jgi:transcriptional regulator with XRE-family HTH domain
MQEQEELSMVYKDFIQKIFVALKEKKVTLKKVSSYAGIDISYLSKILSGKRNPPDDEETIVKIAKILDIDEDELIFSAGRIPKKYQKNFSNKEFLKNVLLLIKKDINKDVPLMEKVTENVSLKKEIKKLQPDLVEQKISDELL